MKHRTPIWTIALVAAAPWPGFYALEAWMNGSELAAWVFLIAFFLIGGCAGRAVWLDLEKETWHGSYSDQEKQRQEEP